VLILTVAFQLVNREFSSQEVSSTLAIAMQHVAAAAQIEPFMTTSFVTNVGKMEKKRKPLSCPTRSHFMKDSGKIRIFEAYNPAFK
jgi:hypothetical protein